MTRFDGRLLETWDELLSPPSVGEYVADAVLSFACGKDVKAEVEYIEEKGDTVARVRIIKVIESGYEEGLYEGSSRY